MASQEFLASFAVDIDEGGVARLQEILAANRELADRLAASFGSAAAEIRAFTEELSALPGLPSDLAAEGVSGLAGLPLSLDTGNAENSLEAFREKAAEPIRVDLDASDSLGEGNDQPGRLALDLTEARANLEAFRADAAKPVSLSASASGMVSAARSAYSSIKSLFSAPIPIKAKVEKEGDEDRDAGGLPGMSAGGRFSKPMNVRVAEDGDAEYIIPVKKENRAVPLLRQLLSELSPAARASLSLPGDNALSAYGGLAAGAPAAPQITQNHSNVSAPVTIQVRSTGANAEQVGQKLYDTAERYLLRTLKSVMA